MKQLVIFPTGTLDAKTKERLAKANYVAIEHSNPESVRVCTPTVGQVDPVVLLSEALQGMSPHYYSTFLDFYRKKLLEQIGETKP